MMPGVEDENRNNLAKKAGGVRVGGGARARGEPEHWSQNT